MCGYNRESTQLIHDALERVADMARTDGHDEIRRKKLIILGFSKGIEVLFCFVLFLFF